MRIAPLNLNTISYRAKKPVAAPSKDTLDRTKYFLSLNPKRESYVIIDDNKIINFGMGSEAEASFGVDLAPVTNKSKSLILIHTHPKTPEGVNLPISLGDCETLIKMKGLRSITAINEEGEFSTLKKRDGAAFTPNDFIKIQAEFFTEFNRLNLKEGLEFLETQEGAKFTHKFWKENAAKFNLIYQTNYAGLK